MSYSGDAAEQVVKMSLEGVEVAARITGIAAKEIAILLIAALKNKSKTVKTKGKERLGAMLKSGKALEIFSIRDGDLEKFSKAAKQYGIVYCVLRQEKNSPDGLCDVMVKADDAPKISRIIERYDLTTIDRAQIESDIEQEMAGKATDRAGTVSDSATPGEGSDVPDVNDTEKLVDDLMSAGKAEPDAPEVENKRLESSTPQNTRPENMKQAVKEQQEDRPFTFNARQQSPGLSEPISVPSGSSERGSRSKSSVKEELREIKAERKAKESSKLQRDDRQVKGTRKDDPAVIHKQPPASGKAKKNKGDR